MRMLELLEEIVSWVWQTSWQASVLVGLVLLVQWLSRSKLAPGFRYAFWLLVMARLVIPIAPASSFSVFNWVPAGASQEFKPATLTPGRFEHQARHDEEAGQAAVSTRPEAVPGAGIPFGEPSVEQAGQVPSFWQTLGLIWLAGAAILGGLLFWQYGRFKRRLTAAQTVCDSRVVEAFEHARRAVGLRKAPDLLETDSVDCPALFGFLRNRLLLPKGLAASLTVRELRHVFLHEAAHLKRGDMLLNWLVTVFQVIHWFNPVLWFGFSRMRADREVACDAMALSRSDAESGQGYAQTIIKLLEGFSRPRVLPGLVGILEDKSQVRRRIAMIAGFKKGKRWPIVALAVLAGLALVTLTDAQDSGRSDTLQIIEDIRKLGGEVTFENDQPGGGVVGVSFSSYDEEQDEYSVIPGFNDEMAERVGKLTGLRNLNLAGSEITDRGLSYLAGLTSLETLDLAETMVTDGGLESIQALSQLKELNLSETLITGTGLANLRYFPNLRTLSLHWIDLDDSELANVLHCPQLERLLLFRNKITDAGLVHLAGLKYLTDLQAGGNEITGTGLAALTGLKHLRVLGLPIAKITDQGLEELSGLVGLQRLNLNFNPALTDAGLAFLKGLPNLIELGLHGNAIAGDGLAHLSGLSSLRSLRLHGTKVDDAALRHIETLSNLKFLGLTFTRITEAGLGSVAKLPELEELYLWNTQVGRAGLSSLKKLKSLKKLQLPLTNPEITDDDLRELKNLHGVTTLQLRGTRITDAGLSHLRELDILTGLYLSKTSVTDEGLEHLRDLRTLREIDLSETAVTDAGLVNLAELRELRTLNLAGTKVTGTGFSHLARLSNLRSLDLNDSPISDEGLASIKGLRGLSALYLRNSVITDAGLIHLAGLPRLQDLDLDSTSVSDKGLAKLKPLARLVYLQLKGTRVTDAGVPHLLEFPELFALFLDDTSISDTGLAQLKTLPKLRNLRVSGTRVSRDGLTHFMQMKRLRWLTLDENLVDEKVRTDFKQTHPDLSISTVQTKADTQAALDAVLSSAAEETSVNPNGVWTWTIQRNSREWVLQLKLEGETLTGTITGYEGPARDSTPLVAGGVATIQDARIRGDVVSFREIRHANGVEWSLHYAGKIIGDTIQGKVEVQRENEPPTIGDWRPKRRIAK